MIRSAVLGILGAAALTASANAADIYRNGGGLKDGPIGFGYNWSGFYLGVNGGYAWGESELGADVGAGTIVGSSTIDVNGGFGGGQIGYNFQRGNIVYGLEVDLQGAGVEGEGAISLGGYHIAAKSELTWFGTVRGRLGYAADKALIYATGGLAFGNVKDALKVDAGQGNFSEIWVEESTTGWVVGGGVEYALTPAWSVKGEYQFLNLDDTALSAETLRGVGALTSDHDFHTVRAGINYHFGRGYEPLK